MGLEDIGSVQEAMEDCVEARDKQHPDRQSNDQVFDKQVGFAKTSVIQFLGPNS